MNQLIIAYDNILIYYPNVFFTLLLLISFLLATYLFKSLISIFDKKKLRKLWKLNYKPKSKNLRRFPLFVLVGFLEAINKTLDYFQCKIEKILKKIGKEILLEK